MMLRVCMRGSQPENGEVCRGSEEHRGARGRKGYEALYALPGLVFEAIFPILVVGDCCKHRQLATFRRIGAAPIWSDR